MYVDGEVVVPAVVVFGNGEKKELKASLHKLSNGAASAVCSIHKITNGAPRSILHCKASNLQLVQSLVGIMRGTGGWRVAVYEDKSVLPKNQQANYGLAGAIAKADLCRNFANGISCPHVARKGKCRFHCWGGPPQQ